MTDTTSLMLTHWGLYRVRQQDGRLVELKPVAEDQDPSGLGASMLGAREDALRIHTPMVRAGFLREGAASREARGRDAFVPVSWEQASDLVACEMRRIIDRHGNAAIFGGSYGWASAGRFHHAQSQLHRFLNLAGGYTRSVNTHSYAAAEVLLPHVLGNRDGLEQHHTSWSMVAGYTELFVAFGGLPLKNTQVSAGGVGRHSVRQDLLACRARGTHFVNISPLRDDIDAAFAPEWIAVRPNTDTALILALAHCLLSEGRHDTAFLGKYTVGFETVSDYLLGRQDGVVKTAAWAAEICDVPAEVIRDLARRMAGARTMIGMAWSLQRADHGGAAALGGDCVGRDAGANRPAGRRVWLWLWRQQPHRHRQPPAPPGPL